MQTQEVEVTITPDGRVSLQVRGVPGHACLDLTRDLEQLLGGTIESREMTYEADQQAIAEDEQQQQHT